MTPTSLDFLGNYHDGIQKLPYTVGYIGAAGTTGNQGTKVPVIYDIIIALPSQNAEAPPADITLNGYTAQTFASYPNNTLSYDMNRPGASTWYHNPRGGWQLLKVYCGAGAIADLYRAPLLADTTVYVKFRVVEPLLINQFTFGCQDPKQGMMAIQNMTFQMNMLPNANRAWRSVSTAAGYNKTATVIEFNESQLFFEMYTPKASQMLNQRNVIPYYDFPIFRSTVVALAAAAGVGTVADGSFPTGETKDLQSSSIQESVVADKLIIFVRRTNTSLTCCDTDNF